MKIYMLMILMFTIAALSHFTAREAVSEQQQKG
jgi:hypothetical protein